MDVTDAASSAQSPSRGSWLLPRFVRRSAAGAWRVLTFKGPRARRRSRRAAKRTTRVAPLASLTVSLSYLGGEDDEDALQGTATSAPEGADVTSMLNQEVLRTLQHHSLSGSSYFPLRFKPTYQSAAGSSMHAFSSVAHATNATAAASTVDGRPQRLVAAGSRLWGSGSWMDARSLLGVRVYDFAVYADEHAVRQHCSKQAGGSAMQSQGHAVLQQLLQDSQVPVSLVLRAARDLPLPVLAREMEAVLCRRYAKAGGSPECPHLQHLLNCFSQQRLPKQLVTGASEATGSSIHEQHEWKVQQPEHRGAPCVRSGSTMVFSRGAGGSLFASAFTAPVPHAMLHCLPAKAPGQSLDDTEMSSTGQLATQGGGLTLHPLLPRPLTEPRVSLALLDLYMGDPPVSKKAKDAAISLLDQEIVMALKPTTSADSYYVPAPGQSLRCISSGSRSIANPNACIVQLH